MKDSKFIYYINRLFAYRLVSRSNGLIWQVETIAPSGGDFELNGTIAFDPHKKRLGFTPHQLFPQPMFPDEMADILDFMNKVEFEQNHLSK